MEHKHRTPACTAVICRNWGMSKVFFSNLEKRKCWHTFSLCPIFCELSMFWMPMWCQRCGGLWAAAHVSELCLGVSTKHSGEQLALPACHGVRMLPNRWHCQQGMKWDESRPVCASGRLSSYSSCKKKGKYRSRNIFHLLWHDLIQWYLFSKKRNHREGRCKKLQFSTEIEPPTAKESGNNYHTRHLPLPTGTLPQCRGDTRSRTCEKKVLEECTFHGGEVWKSAFVLNSAPFNVNGKQAHRTNPGTQGQFQLGWRLLQLNLFRWGQLSCLRRDFHVNVSMA